MGILPCADSEGLEVQNLGNDALRRSMTWSNQSSQRDNLKVAKVDEHGI